MVADGCCDLYHLGLAAQAVGPFIYDLGALFALDQDGLLGGLNGDGHDLSFGLCESGVELLLGVQGYPCALSKEDFALEVI
jgi:hypothetical protein